MAPDSLVPGHCTGWQAQHILAAAGPDNCVQASNGTRYLRVPRNAGPAPCAESHYRRGGSGGRYRRSADWPLSLLHPVAVPNAGAIPERHAGVVFAISATGSVTAQAAASSSRWSPSAVCQTETATSLDGV
jgi:hypothetical protein